mgnify:CR=1 FL=1
MDLLLDHASYLDITSNAENTLYATVTGKPSEIYTNPVL